MSHGVFRRYPLDAYLYRKRRNLNTSVPSGIVTLSGTIGAQSSAITGTLERVITVNANRFGTENQSDMLGPDWLQVGTGTRTSTVVSDNDPAVVGGAAIFSRGWVSSQTAVLVVDIEKDAVARTTRFPAIYLQFQGNTVENIAVAFSSDTGTGAIVVNEINTNGGSASASIIDLTTQWRIIIAATTSDNLNTGCAAVIYPAWGIYSTAYTDVNVAAQGDLTVNYVEAKNYPADYLISQESDITGNISNSTLVTLSGTTQSQDSDISGGNFAGRIRLPTILGGNASNFGGAIFTANVESGVPGRGLQGNSIEDASATQSGARDLNIFGSTFVWRGAEVFIKKDAVAKTTRFASFEYFASGVFSRVASIRLDTSTGESAITGTQNDFVAGVESHDSNWWRVWMYYREADGNTSEFISLYPARGAGTDLTVDDAAAQGEVIYSGFRAFEPAITPADNAVLTGNITVVPASSTITMSGTVQVQVAGISGDVRLRHVVNPATAIGFGNTRVTYVADEGEEPPTGQNLVTESVEDSNATNDAWRFGTVTTEAINDWYCVRAFVLKDAIGKATRFPSLRFYTSGTALKIASIQFDTNTGEFLVENDTEMDAVGNVESFDAAWWLVTLYAKVENANNNYVLQLHPAYGAGTDLSVKDNTATGKITYAGYAGYTPQLPNAQSADISGSIVTAGVIALSGTVQAQPILLHAAIKRGNVLTFESDFTNAIWAPGFDNLTSVTPNSDTAPDGTLTADTLTDSDSNSPDRARQTMVSWSPVLPIFTSLYVKKDAVAKETRFAALRIEFAKDSSSSGLLVAHNIVFDTQDGSYELQSTAGEEDYNLGGGVVSVDDDWWYVYLIAVNSDGASTEAEIAVHPAMGNYTTFWDQNNTINGSIVAWNAHAEFIQETGVDRLIGVIQAQEGLGIGVIERAITLDGTIQAEAPLLQADNLVQTQDSAITGNVTVSGAITMSGTIQSQSSIITGDIERAVVLSGTVQSEAPGISGDIERIVTSSGTIQAAAADISGNIVTAGVIVLSGAVQAQSPIITGDVERVITTSGVVQAQNSDITGTISRLIESSGVVTSAAADISGSIVTAGVIALSGSLQAQASGISGVMERIITASGTIQAQDSTLTGDIERVITSSGVIASANAVVVGDIERIITMLGTLPSGSSSITGAVERVITSSGIVSAQSSDVSGSIVTAGNIVMSGTISSADSQITGDVSNFGNTFISGIADAQNATVTATIKRQLDYTGTVNAENAGVIGEVERVITLSGNVSSDAAAITSGIIDAFKTMSGTIQAQNAQVVGDVERIVTMSGLIGAEAANVVGDVERIITMSGIVQTDNSTLTGVFVIGEVPQEIYNVTLHINRDIMFTTNIQQSENQSLHVVPTAEISLNLIDESTFEVN